MRHLYGVALFCTLCSLALSETGHHVVYNENEISTGYNSASQRLDAQISYLISKIPGLLHTAKDSINSAGSSKELRYQVYGASIILASWKEVIAEWIIEGRSLMDFGGTGTISNYGFLIFYGFGFGLGTTWAISPFSEITCGPYEFKEILQEYGFSDGIAPYLGTDYQDSLSLSPRICEFEAVLKMKLNCILSLESESMEAADVAFAIEELIEAMKIRLDWEMRY
eukprot:TRINITY_DN494_c0_g1_i2.p1 TRINITY_DN494_c0_g1~~TRINITY_DN494_c0_g1_i2.p1  ORF type:complete len:225 (+),score=56.89 TRINITY_DN494_c0_g1_i2:291-965(+)